ncbi:toll/interleukin-1 receptor domain-containing protein [Tsukamurella pulmonis]|uniref:toll/interleukin-1 receptor domain-containing protein n=1 Tax=Tsukamurella pulmonis TaxID=47312 RepID=UPI001EDE9197|nr:toll/interleukin-1 receptor domain-containing protein [Tsukamurella pulmonis]
MAISTKDRINLVIAIVEELENPDLSWDRKALILNSYGVEGFDLHDINGPTLTEILGDASNEQLAELAEHFELDVPKSQVPVATAVTVKGNDPLFIFASHLTKYRKLVGNVGKELEMFGIELFVAHDSIEDDAEWREEIETGLRKCHAGVVFLHEGFKDSAWCDQEVGWMMGRGIPVLPLNFGATPYGFLGKLQANPMRTDDPTKICDKILTRLKKSSELAGPMASSLILGMRESQHFHETDEIWGHLRELSLDADQCSRLLEATKQNGQVSRANVRISGDEDWDKPYPRVIVDFLRRQSASKVVASDIDAYEAYLNQV